MELCIGHMTIFFNNKVTVMKNNNIIKNLLSQNMHLTLLMISKLCLIRHK
jgi:hypothetical protein